MADPRQPTFSIVVPTYRRADVLGRTLDALLATDYPADLFEIIVVDDANDAETRQVVSTRASGRVQVKLLPGVGRGAAAARNIGAEEASRDYLVFVDDDILVAPNHLSAQLDVRAAHGECISGADWFEFTPEVVEELEATPLGRYRLALESSYRTRRAERWSLVEGLATAHFTLPRDRFKELGGFDERFPRAGAEDWEFCLRARERGHQLVLDNGVLLLHDDRRLTLEQLCLREEWRGLSVGVLARMRLAAYKDTDVYKENAPVQSDDSLRVRIRKAIKRFLGTPVVLSVLHRGVHALERVLRPERLLHRLYTAVISVHYLRGFRAGFASPVAEHTYAPTAPGPAPEASTS